jgi:hypothetical protein
MKFLSLACAFALLALAPFAARAQQPPVAPVTVTATPAPVPTFAPANGANLNISPKRVTLDRNHRTGTIYVFNQGTGAGTFDISLVDRVMLPDGQILPVADAQANPAAKAVADRVKSAQPILQVSPRRITLNPGQGQTVRLRVSGTPDDPAVVELRSHLTISSLPPRESGTTPEAAAANAPDGQLRFQINALLGLSVPAIVRLADPDVRAGIENAHVTFERIGPATGPLTPVLSFDLVRQGANSLFGNIEVKPQGQARAPVIGLARGVGVYTEIDRRAVQIALSRAPAPGEHLEVTFTDDDTSPGKLLARSVL